MKRFSFLLIIICMISFNGNNSNAEDQKEVVFFSYACCKVCKQGKACGDSCIAKDKQCHKPKGCACNG